MKLIKGNIVYTKVKEKFEVYENGFLLIKENKILDIGFNLDDKYPNVKIEDRAGHLIMPSFVDLHCHAVQYGNLGMGFDKSLLDWLETYTFPEEENFSNNTYAKNVFSLLLKDIVNQGTTSIAFYSSIHPEAAKLLMKMCHESGIKAYVGKVCMDRNSPDFLCETVKEAIDGTKEVLKITYPNVKGIVTPRFVPTCTEELQKQLGELVGDDIGVQTHLSENLDEIEWVKSLHPKAKGYLDVYDAFGLIGPRTLLGHCIYCTDEEVDLIKAKDAYVVHCPASNFNLTSGLMPIRKYLDKAINLGLGTDVGAGHNLSIKTAMIQSIQMSKCYEMVHPKVAALSLSEAFYLGTKGGGKYFGKTGSFEKDYDADFLVVKPSAIEAFKTLSPTEAMEKFIYAGSRSDIVEVYANGLKIKG